MGRQAKNEGESKKGRREGKKVRLSKMKEVKGRKVTKMKGRAKEGRE